MPCKRVSANGWYLSSFTPSKGNQLLPAYNQLNHKSDKNIIEYGPKIHCKHWPGRPKHVNEPNKIPKISDKATYRHNAIHMTVAPASADTIIRCIITSYSAHTNKEFPQNTVNSSENADSHAKDFSSQKQTHLIANKWPSSGEKIKRTQAKNIQKVEQVCLWRTVRSAPPTSHAFVHTVLSKHFLFLLIGIDAELRREHLEFLFVVCYVSIIGRFSL